MEKEHLNYLKMFKGRIKIIYAHRHTLWDIALKQLKAKYASSILGISWAIVNPLLMMAAITLVFSFIFKTEIKNFPLFILSGIFPWLFFSNTLSEATFSILNQKAILGQFNLPKEILPLSTVLSNFLNFLIGWLIIYPLFIFFNTKIFLLLPLLIIVLFMHLFFIAGLGMALSVLNVLFRDTGQLLGIILMFWFWVTPVFYSLDAVPKKFIWIFSLNPMTPYILFYRDIIYQNEVPHFSIFIGAFIWASISLILGFSVFARLETKILKYI